MSFTSVIIRKAEPLDINQMVGLLKELFSIEEDFTFREPSQRSGLAMMLDSHDNRCIMVAAAEERIIGMCSAQLLVSTAQGGVAALIEDMAVTQEYRGQGIGGKLLFSIEKWADKQGAKRVQLLADKNNSLAIDFYKKHNWTTTQLICLRKNY